MWTVLLIQESKQTKIKGIFFLKKYEEKTKLHYHFNKYGGRNETYSLRSFLSDFRGLNYFFLNILANLQIKTF